MKVSGCRYVTCTVWSEGLPNLKRLVWSVLKLELRSKVYGPCWQVSDLLASHWRFHEGFDHWSRNLPHKLSLREDPARKPGCFSTFCSLPSRSHQSLSSEQKALPCLALSGAYSI